MDVRCAGKASKLWRMVAHAARYRRAGFAGAAIVGIVTLVALMAPWVSPLDPLEIDLAHRYIPPGGAGFLLGSDGLGRDVLSRLIWGARFSLIIAIVPVALASIGGLALGSIAGSWNRLAATVVMRTLDIFFGLPPLMLAIALALVLGPGLNNMVIAMTVVLLPPMTRIAQQTIVVVRELPYVEAARASGARDYHVILHHIVPNAVAPMIAYAVSMTGLMVVFGAGLSFLGLGIQPPYADWGRMIIDAKDAIAVAPFASIFPGIGIFMVSAGFNLLADSLRDALDPRLRR